MYELMIVGLWGLVAIMALVVLNVAERKQWAEERRDFLIGLWPGTTGNLPR